MNKGILLIIFILILIIVFSSLLYKHSWEHLNSKKKQLVFLHIPKNSGSSIKYMYKNIIKVKIHSDSFPKKNQINFAIIRNPVTRLQSIFAHIKNRTHENTSNDLKEFKTLHDLAEAYYNPKNSNHKKAKILLEWDFKKLKKYKEIKKYNGGCAINNPCIHWCPQYLYVYGHGAKIDYLLKYENLRNDLEKFNKLNRIIIPNLSKHNRLSFKNVSPYKYKQLTKMTSLCKKLVRDIYGKDYELWIKSGLN
jgi:hypothetical protein